MPEVAAFVRTLLQSKGIRALTSAATSEQLLLLRLRGFRPLFLDRRLRRRQSRHRHAERRAAHISQAGAVAELHRVRVAAVFAADAEFDVGASLAAFLDGDLHQLADAGLVDRRERILLHNLQFCVVRQELLERRGAEADRRR